MATDATGADPPVSADLERLLRWEAAGAVWRVAVRTDRRVAVSLLRCDGGEEVDRVASDDPALLAYVGGRDSSDTDT